MVVETGIGKVDNSGDSNTGNEKDWMLLYGPTGCWKEEEASSWSPNAWLVGCAFDRIIGFVVSVTTNSLKSDCWFCEAMYWGADEVISVKLLVKEASNCRLLLDDISDKFSNCAALVKCDNASSDHSISLYGFDANFCSIFFFCWICNQ